MITEKNQRLEELITLLRDLSADQDPITSINNYSVAVRHLYGKQGLISVSLRGMQPGFYRVMRFFHQDSVSAHGYQDIPFAGAGAPAHQGGLLGEIIESGRPAVIRNLQIEHDPVLGDQLRPYRLIVAAPVFDLGRATNWVLYLHTDPDALSQEDIEMRVLQSNLMGGITNSKRVNQELREAMQWIQREVDEVANIQRNLLPPERPHMPGLETAVSYGTYDRAGGDYYDLLSVRPFRNGGQGTGGGHGIFIGDAAGHGPSAAVVVAMLSALLHSRCARLHEPAEAVAYLNRQLNKRRLPSTFVTAVYALFDAELTNMIYCNAGHNLPLVKMRDGTVTRLPQTGGYPLGILEDAEYVSGQLSLEGVERILFYTDGITEARSPWGDFFGEARLQSLLAACGGSAQDSIDCVLEALKAHENGERPADDQTMVVVRLI